MVEVAWLRPPVYVRAEQLELRLSPGVPWDGRSPRGLTRGAMGVILKAGAGGHEPVADPLQLELFVRPIGTRRKRRKAPSAVPLIPLPWEV